MTGIPFRSIRILLLVLGLCPFVTAAEIVEQTSRNGVVVRALYIRGEFGEPALLVLHGFLQSREFPIVHWLSERLAASGYTVLAPTLSLGIHRRTQSLPCDAVHTHRMEDDVQEIEQWLDWLERQGHERTVLIGHNTGGLHALIAMLKRPAQRKCSLVAISLVNPESSSGSDVYRQRLDAARRRAQAGDARLREYPLAYCRRYVAPPAAFVSYARWTGSEILSALGRLQAPCHVVLGEADKRLDRGWPTQLRESGAQVSIVPDANPFLDAQHALDLLDRLNEILKSNG